MLSFPDLMLAASNQLTSSLESARVAFDHNLTKGEAAEAALRKFLRERLPSSVAVTHGQVMDHHGNTSGQLDVILYDALRTPILFTDDEGEQQLVPVEGVIAGIEVKTNLKRSELPTIARSAEKLKSLDRTAYYLSENSDIKSVTYAHGSEYPVLPLMFFVVGFESTEIVGLAEQLNIEGVGKPLDRRIDMMCVIKSGVVVNLFPETGSINALPEPSTNCAAYPTEHALFLFYILISRYLFQAEIPPIAIQNYLPKEFRF